MTLSHKPDLLRQIKEGNPTAKEQINRYYDVPHAQKKLCIVWDTGKKVFLYYSYLISVDLEKDDDYNLLVMQFMAHLVTLKGYHLDILFTRFLMDEPHIIHVIPERYIETCTEDYIVIHASVEK